MFWSFFFLSLSAHCKAQTAYWNIRNLIVSSEFKIFISEIFTFLINGQRILEPSETPSKGWKETKIGQNNFYVW